MVDAITQSIKALNGHVVSEPALIVEHSKRSVCLGTVDEAGRSSGKLVEQCVFGKQLLMPDYGKPYLVTSKMALGKLE